VLILLKKRSCLGVERIRTIEYIIFIQKLCVKKKAVKELFADVSKAAFGSI
jgi:hypothetical protein